MYDSFNLHKKIKEVTGTHKKKQIGILKNNNGDIITNAEDKIKHWTEYIKELFHDNRPPLDLTPSEESGQRISKEEIKYALKNMKNKKAPGPDNVPTELLKILDDNGLIALADLFNSIYDLGSIPKEWLSSTFITLPKKTNAKECSDYRTIALMSHTLKLFLKIIHLRIYEKLEAGISDSQFGFRSGMGTREALFAVNILIQRCLDLNKDIHACFIDFEKAFDKVQHEKLKQILIQKNINTKDIQIITSLYWNQTAKIKVEEGLSEDIMILRGVRQGCVLSPLLFNTYSEAIFEETLKEHKDKGIKIGNEVVNNIRYADDTVMLSDSIQDLQQLVNNLNQKCNEFGLKMNLKKTKLMLISKTPKNNVNLTIDGVPIDKVSSYKYLGTWLHEDNNQTKEIRCRIEIARHAFIKMKKCLCSRDINLKLRTRILKCYVFSTLLYGAEVWTLKKNNEKNINAFEMWCYRRMLRIPWTDKVTNVEVLRRMDKIMELEYTIKKKKLEYLGHILRGPKYKLLNVILEGKIEGRRGRGRRRKSWGRNLRDWYGCADQEELMRIARNKDEIAIMISNLR
ncbi:hypothetical protein M8J77_007970 [Diaphorina citri]|nr:hypothetical protein M8J77_007970 [Diaphorina citri]